MAQMQKCSLCDHARGRQASSWCPECGDFLCKCCNDHHSRSSSTKHHEIVSKEDYLELTDTILSISNVCVHHNKKYEWYCKYHEDLCCTICFKEKHISCADELLPIHDSIKNSKTSVSMDKLESNLRDVQQGISAFKKTISKRKTEIHEQKQQCLSKINDMRKTINAHLDKLQEELVQDLATKEESIQTDLEQKIDGVNTKLKLFTQMQTDITKLKQHASNLQVFIGVKDMTEKTEEEIRNLQSYQDCQIFHINVDILDQLTTFVNTVPYFGKVSTELVSFTLPLSPRYIDMQAHDKVSPFLTKKSEINLPNEKNVFVHGCEIMKDGKYLFTDIANRRIIICCNEDSDSFDYIDLKSKPFDVVNTSNDIIAVTLPDKKSIVFFDVVEKNKLSSLNLGHCCYGIASNSECLAVRLIHSINTSDHEIVFYNHDGKLDSRVNIPGNSVKTISYIGSEIKCSNFQKHTMFCYNKQGDQLWDFCDKNIIQCPSGITEDGCGLTYVVGQETNNVIVISAKGELCKQILSEEDGLDKPYAIRINVLRNELLVCNFSGKAFVYSLG